MIGSRPMFPVAQKVSAVTISHVPGGESSQETEVPAKWSQRHITHLPPEVLSHLFGFLGCDDIVQVYDTCLLFREVVVGEHAQALFYSQFPKRFREQYQQSWSWQKRMARNGHNPFANGLRDNNSKFFNTVHRAAPLCIHTLRKMMSSSLYRPVQVHTNLRSTPALRFDCRLNSGNLLLYDLLNGGASMLSRNGTGSWSEEIVDLDESGRRLLSVLCPDGHGGLHFNFGFHNAIEYLKRDGDSGRWQLINQQWVKESDNHAISRSGRYVASYTCDGGIKEIRCLDDQGQWVLMSMAEGTRIGCGIRALQFSPSGQHLAIRYEERLAVISQVSQGCWNLTWQTPWKKPMTYIEFCPSERWLLVGFRRFRRLGPEGRSTADIIRLDSAGKFISRQEIDCKNCQLNFSPAGNYLVSGTTSRDHRLLWRLLKSEKWVFYGNLADPEAGPLSVTDPEVHIIQFSPCENYLLISSRDGAVTIWGQVEQRHWEPRGMVQQDGELLYAEFSPSGVHALTIDRSLIRIWGRDEGGLWPVKGAIPVSHVWSAFFHPVAEHLIVFGNGEGVQVWEVRKDNPGEEADRSNNGTLV